MTIGWTDEFDPFQDERAKANGNSHDPEPLPNVWDAVDTLDEFIPPREWLLGNIFCKGFTSSLVGAGAAGKTAVRLVQALAVATGQRLTEEHVHKRAKVLFLCFEDGEPELKRRIKAALLYHKVTAAARGWLFCTAITGRKLFTATNRGAPYPTALFDWLVTMIRDHGFELVILDPFIKIHAPEENDNSAIEQVCAALSHLGVEMNIAIDLPHHVLHIARRQQIGLLDEVEDLVLAPGVVLEAPIGGRRVDHRLGVFAHDAPRGVLPERQVVLPEAQAGGDQSRRVGDQPRGHLHERAGDVQRIGCVLLVRLALQPFADDAL